MTAPVFETPSAHDSRNRLAQESLQCDSGQRLDRRRTAAPFGTMQEHGPPVGSQCGDSIRLLRKYELVLPIPPSRSISHTCTRSHRSGTWVVPTRHSDSTSSGCGGWALTCYPTPSGAP